MSVQMLLIGSEVDVCRHEDFERVLLRRLRGSRCALPPLRSILSTHGILNRGPVVKSTYSVTTNAPTYQCSRAQQREPPMTQRSQSPAECQAVRRSVVAECQQGFKTQLHEAQRLVNGGKSVSLNYPQPRVQRTIKSK